MKHILQNNNVLSLAATGGGAVLGFASFILLVKSLDRDVFGAWAFYLSTSTMLEMGKTGFVQTPLVRHLASAQNRQEKERVIASAFIISLGLTMLLSIGVGLTAILFPSLLQNTTFSLFFIGFPFYTIATLPHNFASWIFQAEHRFDKVLAVRLVPRILFILLLLAALTIASQEPSTILACHIFSLVLASIVSWLLSGIRFATLLNVSRPVLEKLTGFGKYSTGTLIGSNLLRSSDITILGIVLGADAVAVYHVAQKIVEFIEIPLRSLASVAFPRLSRDAMTNLKESVTGTLRSYALPLTLLIIPVAVLSFIYAAPVVTLLGGSLYDDAVLIVRIFAVSLLFFPFDRFTGVILDSINRPDLNFYKVMAMLAVNIIGDIVVLQLFGTAASVAAVTIATFMSGAVWGGFVIYTHVFQKPENTLQ
ncbi:lipopolysaccharide biosynthesis protein [Prosthecochloris sp. ZM_2]|uniref:lipopolysaccharide biosynthesis protein n=1 Tax=Prosthecochloris sp. ZM_2 TaxID=2045206 RepID=UPI001314C20D|nr:oligosaccharide flippase family protein [Prosthecochloris sp. ZM_2]